MSFTEEDLKRKGYVQNEKGEWVPGVIKRMVPVQRELDKASHALSVVVAKVGRPTLMLTEGEQKKLLKKFKKGKYPESKLQQRCVAWFRNEAYPQYRWLLFAIPNGGFRKKATAKILNAEGALSGVWDLFLAIPLSGKHGLWIEMKIKPNKLTDNQLNFLKEVESMHYATAVCYTYEEFQTAIINYLNPKP